MTDRRARLRPKDGARGLYYGGGSGSIASNFRQNLLGKALGDIEPVEWLSNRPAATQSPTTPNSFIDSISSTITDPFNSVVKGLGFGGSSDSQGIGEALNARDSAGITDALAKKTGANTSDISISFTDSQSINVGSILGSVSSLFGSKSKGSSGNVRGIMEPLAQTNGMVFPFTPTIDFAQEIDYSSYDPVHSNQELHSYTRTKAPKINVTGKFTVQNSFEASYALASLHFCRTVSKMAFGKSQNAGTPPPVLLFSAYGDYIFNDVPVIVTAFNMSFPEDVDYVLVPNSNSWMPSMFSIQISLTVQNTPDQLRSFSLEKFRSGQLLKNKGWV